MVQRASQETKLLGFSSVMCFHAMYILSAAPAYLHHSSTNGLHAKTGTRKLTNSADESPYPLSARPDSYTTTEQYGNFKGPASQHSPQIYKQIPTNPCTASPFQSWILEPRQQCLWQVLTYGRHWLKQKTSKSWILKPKTASIWSYFWLQLLKKRKHLTLNLKPEMASKNLLKRRPRLDIKGPASICYIATNTTLDQNRFLPVAFLIITCSSHHLAISTLFRCTPTNGWPHELDNYLTMVCKITLRLWIQNLNQT